MHACPYCGRDNDEPRAKCRECGTELRRDAEPVRDRSLFSRRLRVALGFIGVGGGMLWFFLGCLILLFHGFGPGGAQGGMSRGEWALCIVAVLITFFYYAVVSGSVWSRALLFTGVAVHVVWLVAVVCIVGLSDGGFIFAPLFFGGAACWIAYVTMTPDAHKTD